MVGMGACVIATVLASRLKRTSIYTEKLTRRSIKLFEPFEVNVMKHFSVASVITREPVMISKNTPFQDMIDLVVTSPHNEFFVVRENNQYVGTISVRQLREVILDRDWLDQLIIAGDIANTAYPTLKVDDNLHMAMKSFAMEFVDEVPVISEGELVGSVRKRDVLDIYNREVLRRDLPGGFQGALTWAEKIKSVDLGEDYIIAELEAPPHFVGKTLRELNVRATYNVQVILIKRAAKDGGTRTVISTAEYIIEHGDILLLAGKRNNVKKLSV